jgi:hypothetical protein
MSLLLILQARQLRIAGVHDSHPVYLSANANTFSKINYSRLHRQMAAEPRTSRSTSRMKPVSIPLSRKYGPSFDTQFGALFLVRLYLVKAMLANILSKSSEEY